jgi:hypothetical protein
VQRREEVRNQGLQAQAGDRPRLSVRPRPDLFLLLVPNSGRQTFCSSEAHEAKAERRSANPKSLPPNLVCLTCERDLNELVKGNVYDSLAYTLILAYDCVIN